MRYKKLSLLILVLVLSVFLFVGVADAKKKGNKSTKGGFKDDNYMVGGYLGTNIFGAIPYSAVDYTGADGETMETSFSALGGFGPTLGGYFHLLFSGWIVRAEIGYSYQAGQGTEKYDEKITLANGQESDEREFDFGMHDFKLGGGIGKTLIKHKIAHPYFVVVIDYNYLAFRDEDAKESASGSAFGFGGILGIDAKFMKHYFAGGGLRADIIFNVTPLELKDNGVTSEYTMGYLPISFFLTGGYRW